MPLRSEQTLALTSFNKVHKKIILYLCIKVLFPEILRCFLAFTKIKEAIAYNNLATISMIHNLQIIANEISLLIRKTTMNEIQEYDLVALTEDAIAYPLKHEMTRRSPYCKADYLHLNPI